MLEHTGLPMISRITSTTCCHAVRELKSSVASPVPVMALTQQNSKSTYDAGNMPLHAYATAARINGVIVLIESCLFII